MKRIKWLVCMLVLIAAVGLTAGGALAETTVTTFKELQAALKVDGEVVMLGKDIEGDSSIDIDRIVTLDLNGFTCKFTAGYALGILARGQLTLKDTGDGGVLFCDGSTIKMGNQSTFTMESGKLEGMIEVVRGVPDVSINIKGGTVSAGGKNAMHLRSEAKVNIDEGTIEGSLECEENVDLIFSGGTLKGSLCVEGGNYLVCKNAKIEADEEKNPTIIIRKNAGNDPMRQVTVRVTGGSISGANTAIKVEKEAVNPNPIIEVTGGSISGKQALIEVVDPAKPTTICLKTPVFRQFLLSVFPKNRLKMQKQRPFSPHFSGFLC